MAGFASRLIAELIGEVFVDAVERSRRQSVQRARDAWLWFRQVAKERQKAVHASSMQNLSVASATMLAKLARWADDQVHLDARIVLGKSLLADRTRRYIRLDAEGFEAVVVARFCSRS